MPESPQYVLAGQQQNRLRANAAKGAYPPGPLVPPSKAGPQRIHVTLDIQGKVQQSMYLEQVNFEMLHIPKLPFCRKYSVRQNPRRVAARCTLAQRWSI